jgi:predicted RNase H-like nuclease (RuvC/YqgF family)
MDIDKRRILDFLLTTDFDISQGYSYNDLINFLNAYKEFFRDCYNAKEDLLREKYRKDRTFSDYETRINELEKRMEKLRIENEILTKKISRKLTFKERLFGRFKW